MPAQVEIGRFCASWFASYDVPGSKGATYRCSLNGTSGPYCPCRSFKFAPEADKRCKHLDKIHREACLWNVQFHEGNKPVAMYPVAYDTSSEIPGETCPNCHGPVVAVRIAV